MKRKKEKGIPIITPKPEKEIPNNPGEGNAVDCGRRHEATGKLN